MEKIIPIFVKCEFIVDVIDLILHILAMLMKDILKTTYLHLL